MNEKLVCSFCKETNEKYGSKYASRPLKEFEGELYCVGCMPENYICGCCRCCGCNCPCQINKDDR